MIIFPAQYEAYRTRGDGTRILSLSIYQQYATDVAEVINGELGKEYIVIMVPTGTKGAEEFVTETPEETKERFRKHMNALITDIAKQKGMTQQACRDWIKTLLKQEGVIKESTTELDLKGYADVIIKLRKIQHGN